VLNDDLNRREDLNRTDSLGRRDSGMGGMMLAALAALFVLALVLMWAPWNGPRTADNTTPGTTVGSSTTRPAAPAPSPAAPSTAR
jgi:hypothetical protein